MDINSALPSCENRCLAWKAEGNLGRCLGSVGSDGTEGWGLERGSCCLGVERLSISVEVRCLGVSFSQQGCAWRSRRSRLVLKGHVNAECILEGWPG